MTKPTRPPTRPADQIACPGCAVMISRTLIACKPCWRQVPGTLKAKLLETKPGTIGRARVVGDMRIWLSVNARDVTP